MTDLLMDLLLQTLPALIVAIVTALVTVRLSLRRFRREQLLLKRQDAYTRLLDILDTHKRYTAAYEEHYLAPTARTNQELEALRKRWERHRPEYKRLLLLSSVHLPREAREALREYEERRQKAIREEDVLEAIEIDFDATEDCIKKLTNIARRDLGGD